MKKLMFAIAILSAFTTTIYAQSPYVKIGAKAGINIADISSGTKSNLPPSMHGISVKQKNDMIIGWHAGVLTEFLLSKRFSIQPEVLYSTQGSLSEFSMEMKIADETINNTSSVKTNVDYINVPIMFKFYVVEGLNIDVGPQIGFLTRDNVIEKESKTTTKKDGTKEIEIITDKVIEPYESKYQSTDFGINFGLGYATSDGLFIDARYNLGMSNILKNQPEGNKQILKHRVIQISIGFKF